MGAYRSAHDNSLHNNFLHTIPLVLEIPFSDSRQHWRGAAGSKARIKKVVRAGVEDKRGLVRRGGRSKGRGDQAGNNNGAFMGERFSLTATEGDSVFCCQI